MTTEKRSAVSVFVDRHLAALLAEDIPAWVDLWAEDGVFEFPFAPEGYVKRLDGKAAIANYMSGFPEKIKINKFNVIKLMDSPDGDEGFLEFTCEGTVVPTGRPYNMHYVSFLRLRDGKLTLYRDFWNPLVAIEAFGGESEMTRILSGGAA